MPRLSDLNLPSAVHEILSPLVGDKLVGSKEESVWVERGRIRMELEDIGEGWNGDYDEEDPDDRPLLRFSFLARNPSVDDSDGEMVSLDETSYCTSIDANAPWEVRLACACEIFDEVIDKLYLGDDEEADPSLGRNAKRICEELSHTASDGREALYAALQAAQLSQDLPQAPGISRPPRM